ncbi:MAG: class I SAM-dependent methyltransferase [Acidimicrobiales bacterium]
MQALQANRSARQLFDGLPAHYDTLSAVLSFGQDRRWRRAMVDAVAACSPKSVLDVATGPAGVALQLARRTAATVAGVDLTAEMLSAGAANIARSPYRRRIAVALARAEQLPFGAATFDALTFTYLLRYVSDPAATIAEMVRVVRPGGVVAGIEFHTPARLPWSPLWLVYTRLLLPSAGLVLGGPEWWEVGRFLGPSISSHYRKYPVTWHVAAWESAGVQDVRARVMSLGGGLVMWGTKRSNSGHVGG